ncbi:MAG: 3'-5' exonuclease, partial [Candidatus Bathyarchaeia archaeon]
MKVTFWLLDVNYDVGDKGSEIWLWGVDSSGKRMLIVDRNFLAYFYAVVNENADPSRVAKEIEAGHYSSVVKLEIVERRFFGKPVRAVKVYCKDPDVLPKYARALRGLEGVSDCFEDDVRFSMRYLIDNNVVPCGWHEVEVTEEMPKMDVHVDNIYEARSKPKLLGKSDVPQLRIMGFTTVYY